MRVGAVIEDSAQDAPSRATVGITMKMGRSLHLVGTGTLATLHDHAFVITAANVVNKSPMRVSFLFDEEGWA